MSEPLVHVFVLRARSTVRLGWRVVTRNRREVGRDACGAMTPGAARADFELVRSLVESDVLRPVLSSRPVGGGWRWALLRADAEVAASHRAYSRRRECLAPMEQFIDLLRDPANELRMVDLHDVTRRPDRRPLPLRPVQAPLVERIRPVEAPGGELCLVSEETLSGSAFPRPPRVIGPT